MGRLRRRRAARRPSIAAKLADAGFDDVEVDAWRVYNVERCARVPRPSAGIDVDAVAPQVDGKFASAFIRATKPAACCGPACCP